ncbi:AAA family ATPase [Photobacterium damselae]|uniref:AAA family ATPase n=2 Tax=Photobacterium damselae TaxID=38293 RepID=A0A4S2JK68_PHODD|nr:AAA family ATPase [Photobacterium damselae]AWK83447.1 ATP-binding protein [Photobacterium damselae]EHA1081879.1 AAA family ATPase [Photobacterium damselae]EJN6959118.1 AAA family ATPase [Photobacterium damselae]KAB1182796.1 AAA family ATPase [Photobacterium damselae subsp. damselae]KAB1505801.1 AAA family ATPase [Photobacterium damselae subsp. damselae]
MITTLAINNYRSILNLVVPLGKLNVITGANATGKSNLYKALRLLADTAQGGVVSALATEGGLDSTFWAGPETITNTMKRGEHEIESTVRQKVKRLKLGFATDEFSYSISLGLPSPSLSMFGYDPEIKRECIWNGPTYRPSSALIDRNSSVIKARNGRQWQIVSQHIATYHSLFDQIADPVATPEAFMLRETIRGWRFYDHFRTDKDAPARQPQLGTRTPVLHHDGRDLAAALQTIIEIGDEEVLNKAIDYAFPGASIKIINQADGRFSLEFSQYGLLRPLSGAELSDGTLRYLLWVAALLTPRPPSLMVLNEPETSLHPDLLPALARLIRHAAKQTQVWVISHAPRLISALKEHPDCHTICLEKEYGQTVIPGMDWLSTPNWYWPDA